MPELRRSSAAQAIGEAAAASGLLLAHFERRVHLAPPDDWLPRERPDLRGQRADEHKYQHHANENPLGSFNPAHRAKWSAHELCHGLVGFAWKPDAPPLFRVLAAQLSEVVPVALWYFFDEADLRRCPRHDGPLFTAECPACEAIATHPTAALHPRNWRAEGKAFVERELAAVRESMRIGQLVEHRYATLNLSSDALAYATAHAGRLTSPSFARYIQLFHPDDRMGCHPSLEALIARIETVTECLFEGTAIPPLRSTRAEIVAQDLGWRLLMTAADCEGEAADVLDALAVRLAEDPRSTPAVVEGYRAAAQDWWLPPPADLFAVGYPLDATHSLHPGSTEAALTRTCPNAMALLDENAAEWIAAFMQVDQTRGPTALRFADWAQRVHPGPIADLLRYEATCAHPGPADPFVDALGPGAPDAPLMLTEHVNLLRLGIDADALIRALESEDEGDLHAVERPVNMIIRRRAGSEVLVAEISDKASEVLTNLTNRPQPTNAIDLPAAELDALLSLGVIRPARWPIG
jgi:hypothetical protein